MKKFIKILIVLMLTTILFVENAGVPKAAVSTNTIKKLFLEMYSDTISEKIVTKPEWYVSGAEHFSYAYLQIPNQKYPLFFLKDEYNYSICGISIYKTEKEQYKSVKGFDVNNINNFSGQKIYHYKKYIFVEEFAGGGCGRIEMYKYSNGKFKVIKNSGKTFAYSSSDEVHRAAIKYAKKLAKKKGLKFSRFKEVNWKN